jgi:hypothetical protein
MKALIYALMKAKKKNKMVIKNSTKSITEERSLIKNKLNILRITKISMFIR